MILQRLKHFSQKQKDVIKTISLGNLLEWYDIYSYGFQADIIAEKFFGFFPSHYSLISAFALFGIGSIIRPISSTFLFGRLADHNKSKTTGPIAWLSRKLGFGRQPVFLFTIALTTLATFATGCLPTYESWGWRATALIIILRVLTSIGLSGEYTGAMCYLYENSYPFNARFVTSWTGVGNQVGGVVGILETLMVMLLASTRFEHSYGWRLSFWMGGFLGVVIFLFRTRLSETPLFEAIEEKDKFDQETSLQIIRRNSKKIFLGIGYGVINASTYYFLALYLPMFLIKELGVGEVSSLLCLLFLLTTTTILIPWFGRFGDKFSNRMLLISSVTIIITLLLPAYYAIIGKNILLIAIIGVIYLFPVSCITALLGFYLPNLFSTNERFTCVGCCWNIADAVVGGLTPTILLALQLFMSLPSAICFFILLTGLISAGCYTKIRG